ncbi:MAG: efflux RND transporter periplasmic adaptor subunit [Candidatus Thiodiazotropha sp.]
MTDSVSSPRRYVRKLLLPVVIIALTGVVVTYMMTTSTRAQRSKPVRQARLVEVVDVVPQASRLTIEAWGTVLAARQVTLQSQVAGEVKHTSAAFEPGAQVAAGELLLQIDPADYQLAIRQRRADLTKAKAELALEEGKGKVAEQEFELLSQETEPSREQRRLMLREPQRETARADVATAEAALAAAELNLARTRVKAPFNALVMERQVNIGTRVGSGANLATLVDTDTFWVELALPAASLRWLKLPAEAEAGSEVRLYQEQIWGEGRYREGRIIRMRGDLDQKGRMARLLVAISDPLGLADEDLPVLLLGAFVRAEITGRELQDVLSLDRAWVRDNNTLWVMDRDDKLAIRRPPLIYSGITEVYVGDGLEAGDRIITSELAVAVEGMPLRTTAVATGRKP